MVTVRPMVTEQPEMAPRLKRIQAFSNLMVAICYALAAAALVGLVGFWILAPIELLASQAGVALDWLQGFGPFHRAAGLAITLVPAAALVWGLGGAASCFRGFANGKLFGPGTTGGLRRFSTGLFASAILKVAGGAMISVLMSLGAPSGQRQLVVGVSSDTLLLLLFSGMIAVIGWVLAEASAIAEEHAQFF